jgi:proteasome lid subunit RPN8/RPN11
MLRDVVSLILSWLHRSTATWWVKRLPSPEMFVPSAAPAKFLPLQRVVLSNEVSQTLFAEYKEHRRSNRGNEEIGWVMMGVRQEVEVLVLATLPAGTARSASSVHVRFDSEAQALGSRVVRQKDKRLAIVGVVHTHPGSLRHPSEGDFQGDRLWVGQLRGGEGVFGIGTADGPADARRIGDLPHTETEGELCFSWYALAKNDRRYRRLPVQLTAGPDLAGPLHPVWPIVEMHAAALDRLYRQLAGVTLESIPAERGSTLALNLKLGAPGTMVRVLLDRDKVQYYLGSQEGYSAVDPKEDNLERALYLILAELAAIAK